MTGPVLLRVAGEFADGTILWMATAQAIETHVAPRIGAAAATAGRSAPRIVASVLVAVHDDEAQARSAVSARSAIYAGLPNYQRFLSVGGAATPADAAVVGSAAAVRAQLQALADAGATDILADVVPAGPDETASRRRTTNLLRELVS